MKLKHIFFAIILSCGLSGLMMAQSEDLHIFGYTQSYYDHNTYTFTTSTPEFNTFLMQQMNLMFAKNFGTEFTSFVNLEFTNSFSFQDTIGGFKVEEAWLKYSPSPLINIKGGLLVPRFNNFNEIKSKSVLQPYIFRPLAYETIFFNQYQTSEFVPTNANIQIYGDVPINDFHVNYAVYYGNSEYASLNKNTVVLGPGQDATKYKLAGGRLGIEYGDLQAGVSYTSDWKNYNVYKLEYVPRSRFGAYLNYALAGFELEAEYIKVAYNLSDSDKSKLNAAAAANTNTRVITPTDLDKSFIYASLLYNVNDNLSVFFGVDQLNGKTNIYLTNGVTQYNWGACYKVTSAIAFKAQYAYKKFELYGTPAVRNDYLIGGAVNF